MRNRLKIFCLCFFAIILCSCSLITNQDRNSAELIEKNLKLWQNFQLNGLIRLNWKEFNFYKDISIINNENELKVFVYQSGILGLQPKPFARISITDTIVYDLPQEIAELDSALLAGITHEMLFPAAFNYEDVAEISQQRRLENEYVILFFDKKYRLSEITFQQQNFRLLFIYNRQNLPLALKGYSNQELVFQIDIDSFKNIEQE